MFRELQEKSPGDDRTSVTLNDVETFIKCWLDWSLTLGLGLICASISRCEQQ